MHGCPHSTTRGGVCSNAAARREYGSPDDLATDGHMRVFGYGYLFLRPFSSCAKTPIVCRVSCPAAAALRLRRVLSVQSTGLIRGGWMVTNAQPLSSHVETIRTERSGRAGCSVTLPFSSSPARSKCVP